MKTTPRFAAIILFFLGACTAGPRETRVGGVPVLSPTDASTPLPLIVILHGYGANAFWQGLYFSFSDFVEEKRFHLVALEGGADRGGKRYWNASPSCCDLDRSGRDDVASVSKAIEAIRAQISVSKVYLVGHSNGGFMAYRLACDLGDRIAGVVSLAGMDEPRNCAVRTQPLKILQIHGTHDETISDQGGSYRGLPPYPGWDEVLGLEKKRLGCEPSPSPEVAKNYSWALWGKDSTWVEFSCDGGNRLAAIRIEGGSHRPFITPGFRRDVLDFLLQE